MLDRGLILVIESSENNGCAEPKRSDDEKGASQNGRRMSGVQAVELCGGWVTQRFIAYCIHGFLFLQSVKFSGECLAPTWTTEVLDSKKYVEI